MEGKRFLIKSKKQMFIVIGAFTLVMLLIGTTYAFFNYTRTGGQNTVRTGRIAFRAQEGNAINLTNAFPITSGQASQANNPNAKTLSITVTGDTDYADGLEYLVTVTDVHMTTVGDKQVPITIEVGVQDIGTAPNTTSLGTEETGDYYTAHESYTTANKYKVLYDGNLDEGDRLLVGYIAPNNPTGTASGVNGVITIKAYFDADRIAITDTLVGEGEGNGTTTEWVGDRTRFTTTEWNALSSSGLSFRVKVESNEGKWVEALATVPTVLGCDGCVFKYTTSELTYGSSGTELQVGDYDTDYTTTVTNSGKSYFLGLILENGTYGKITRAFACGIKGEDPHNGEAFCIEGKTDGSLFTSNKGNLTTLYGVYDSITSKGCRDGGSNVNCFGAVYAGANVTGLVYVSDDVGSCGVHYDGYARCY